MPTYTFDEPQQQPAAPPAPWTAPQGRGINGRAVTNPGAFNGNPRPTTNPSASGMGYNTSGIRDPGAAAFDAQGTAPPTQAPGNNLMNPGYGEQAFELVQNRLLEDPYANAFQQGWQQTQNQTQGEQFINQNLGTLSGPGQGEQYWNQMSGQYMDPFAGEQFTRQATQNFSPTGQSGAFYNQANSQLGGGTQAESNMAGIASGYGANGTYQGGNNALGQYGANASYGPMAAQSFFDQVGGSYDSMGRYSDPNLAAGQYAQTQGAFGDMPIAEFDPFYDRASQLATQDYNRQAAGRGVYGSSEALSGVGNVITDIEAQRANRSFDAEMQRAQEQRMRQQLLGEQARMGDLSSQGAFAANMSGLQTFGNLANNAGNQTLGQQEMLGNQARQADLTGLEAFGANVDAAETYAGINRDMGQLELDRNQLLGNLANNADVNETNRYTASTNAMNNADRMQLDRSNAGADIAFGVDDQRRQNFDSQVSAASTSTRNQLDRQRQGLDAAAAGSDRDLSRINSFMQNAGSAERDRMTRIGRQMDQVTGQTNFLNSVMQGNFDKLISGDQAAVDDVFNTQVLPALQRAGMSQQDIQAQQQQWRAMWGDVGTTGKNLSTSGSSGSTTRPIDTDNPYD